MISAEVLRWAVTAAVIPFFVWLGKQYETKRARNERVTDDVHTRLRQAGDSLSELRAQYAASTARLDYIQRELDDARGEIERLEREREAARIEAARLTAALAAATTTRMLLRQLLLRALFELRRHDAVAADVLLSEIPSEPAVP